MVDQISQAKKKYEKYGMAQKSFSHSMSNFGRWKNIFIAKFFYFIKLKLNERMDDKSNEIFYVLFCFVKASEEPKVKLKRKLFRRSLGRLWVRDKSQETRQKKCIVFFFLNENESRCRFYFCCLKRNHRKWFRFLWETFNQSKTTKKIRIDEQAKQQTKKRRDKKKFAFYNKDEFSFFFFFKH